eukprot:TRINITY_DN21330_c0_g1_i1.p4 TRINITY_DN21330_c0_g1~~TRINITY_DN21330_c0_g1_i1.p4  ORF type:complete len:131 (-),score=10.28 TRINITY_DN21330_c0_g1_i1:168-503(-)
MCIRDSNGYHKHLIQIFDKTFERTRNLYLHACTQVILQSCPLPYVQFHATSIKITLYTLSVCYFLAQQKRLNNLSRYLKSLNLMLLAPLYKTKELPWSKHLSLLQSGYGCF